jgi:hypothetical protein
MAQSKQPIQKPAPKAQSSSTGGNVLFALAVVAVIGGGVFLFMWPGSSQPAPVAAATTAASPDSATPPADAAPTSDSAAVALVQDAAALPTEPPKRQPPADAVLPPINPENYAAVRPMDQVRAAYEWAAQHPDVAQYVPCFCGCERMSHRGNDDCFVRSRDADARVTAWEPHGMACEVCLDVANDSRRMYASGASVTQIRSAIEQKYKPLAQTMTPTPMPMAKSK